METGVPLGTLSESYYTDLSFRAVAVPLFVSVICKRISYAWAGS